MTDSHLELGCPSELVLDRLVVGEAADAPLRDHVASCARCRGRVAEREQGIASFPHDVSLAQLVRATERRVRAPRRRWPIAAAGAAAAFAAVAIVVVARGDRTEASIVAEGEDLIRRKGGLGLKVIAQRADGSVAYMSSPASLAPGDAIAFSITSDRPGHLGIVGVDAAGAVTSYVPAASAVALRVEAGVDQRLDGSVVLDDTRGFERIVALLCDHSFEMATFVGRARTALAAASGDPARVEVLAPTGCQQATFLVEKPPEAR